MTKLLNAYRLNTSDANALKLRAYDQKHPMARCMIHPDDLALFAAAIHQAGAVLRKGS
jgi:hypothetical protein